MRTHSQLAYILHKRPFRDTSQILEVFTREHGRLSVMSKGSRSPRSRLAGVLQLHKPLLIGWSGRGELPLLNGAEAAELRAPRLTGRGLLAAMYIDELIMYLVHRHDPNDELFALYHDTLYQLQSPMLEPVLRLFEKRLLDQLGFALNLECDADTGAAIEAGATYAYHVEHGPVRIAAGGQAAGQPPAVAGSSLLAYADDCLEDRQILKEIKNLNRHVLAFHLGNRKLKSRDLFRRPQIR